MRADRLLSLLMLLQTRGRMTAAALAAELDVSVRTIYRDVDALGTAGAPIYSDAGHDGGFSLLESYRTTLTGLTSDEVRTLLMLTSPAALEELGLSRELKSARLKLATSLPATRRDEEAQVRQRLLLDPTDWPASREAVPHLQRLHGAVWSDRCIVLTYAPMPRATLTQQVAPYALVAKAGVWHLVFAHGERLHVQRVAGIVAVTATDTPFVRMPGFDLAAFWRSWSLEQAAQRSAYPVAVRVAPGFLPYLTGLFGEEAAQTAREDRAGWFALTVGFSSLESARERLLGLGAGVEVLSPYALRRSIQDVATQVSALYGDAQTI